jgi:hypothetical protein
MAVNLDKNEKSPSGGDNKKKFNFNKPDINPSSPPSESKDAGAAESSTKKASPNFSKSNEGVKSKLDFSKEKIEPKASSVGEKKSSKLPIIIAVAGTLILGIWFLTKSSDSKPIETAQTKTNAEKTANTPNTASPASTPSAESQSSTTPANDSPIAQSEATSESNAPASSAPSTSNDVKPTSANQSKTPVKVEGSMAGGKTPPPSPSKADDTKNDSKAKAKPTTEATKAKDAARPVKPSQSTSTTADLSGSIEEKANKVIKGLFGNGAERRNSLGAEYDAIQAKVNELLRSTNN